MSELSQLFTHNWPQGVTFLLVLGRTSGMVISAPFWGGMVVPRLVRVAIVVSLSFAVYPIVHLASPSAAQEPPALVSLLGALGREVLLGLVLGWAAQLLFVGMRLAGQQMEMKMGLGLTQLINPNEGGQTSLVPALLDLLAALVFLSLNGHHLLIRALASSYRFFPLGIDHWNWNGVTAAELAHVLVVSAGGIFAIALRVSAPVVVGLLLTDILLGIVSRTIPQMNVFVVALPVQFSFGVLLLLLSLPMLVWFCVHLMEDGGMVLVPGIGKP